MTSSDGISILVVCRGRIKLLNDLFESIEHAVKKCPYEVIVVDNSDDDDAKTIERMCLQFGYRYHYDPRSVAIKRNTAASLSNFEILLYLDSDCWIEKDTIAAHYRMYSDQSVGAVSGPVLLEGGTTRFYRCVKDSPWAQAFSSPLNGQDLPWGPTANFSIRKTVFGQIGGFDETFPNKPGGEDVDLGIRITSVGCRIASAPDAVVHHSNKTWDNIHDMNRRLYNYGKADAKLCDKYPDNTISRFPSVTCLALLCSIIVTLSLILDHVFLLLVPLSLLMYPFFTATFATVIRWRRSPKLQDYVLYALTGIQLFGSLAWSISNRRFKSMLKGFMYSPYQYRSACEYRQCCVTAFVSTVLLMMCIIVYHII